MTPLALSLFLIGCSTEVVVPAQRTALDVWREAMKAADAGEPEVASRRIEAALREQPEDVNLLAWRAEWTAQSGRLETAEAQFGEVLSKQPMYDEARYRRAVVRAKRGDAEGCASDMQVLLQHKAVTRVSLRQEAAWSSLLEHPAFAFLVPTPPTLAVRYRERGMYAGTDFDWTVSVRGEELRPLELSASLNGPVRWISTEERWGTVQGEPSVDIVFRFRSTGPGTLAQGPVVVATPYGSASSEGLAVEVEGVATSSANGNGSLRLFLPSEQVGMMSDGPAWRVDEEGFWLLLEEGEEAHWTPPLEVAPVVHTVAREDLPTTRLLHYPAEAPPAQGATLEFGRPNSAKTRHTWMPSQSPDA